LGDCRGHFIGTAWVINQERGGLQDWDLEDGKECRVTIWEETIDTVNCGKRNKVKGGTMQKKEPDVTPLWLDDYDRRHQKERRGISTILCQGGISVAVVWAVGGQLGAMTRRCRYKNNNANTVI